MALTDEQIRIMAGMDPSGVGDASPIPGRSMEEPNYFETPGIDGAGPTPEEMESPEFSGYMYSNPLATRMPAAQTQFVQPGEESGWGTVIGSVLEQLPAH